MKKMILLLIAITLLAVNTSPTLAQNNVSAGLGMTTAEVHPTVPKVIFEGLTTDLNVSFSKSLFETEFGQQISMLGHIPAEGGVALQSTILLSRVGRKIYGESTISVENAIHYFHDGEKSSLRGIATQASLSTHGGLTIKSILSNTLADRKILLGIEREGEVLFCNASIEVMMEKGASLHLSPIVKGEVSRDIKSGVLTLGTMIRESKQSIYLSFGINIPSFKGLLEE
ncbi:MAG: hypothetical protein OXB96_01425 [Candidatus Kaiserbacteria bacterium]|nr:hypothetical protein [Candidatus Kaiserbacteria bacterium]